MINIHLNGDVVRCPDIAAIKKRAAEQREVHNICRYNIHEYDCDVWKIHITAWQKFNNSIPRCMLSGCADCPGHKKQTETGNQEKMFSIDNTVYRKLASTAHYLVKESKTKTLFLTLTFPNFKKKVSYNETNECFSNFVENLRAHYGCGGYIAVREFGAVSHRVHYHILCSIPFISFTKLNAVWCSHISSLSDFSKNAVQSDPKTRFVTDPARAMRYVCKYFSKCKNQRSKTRLVFISNNIIQRSKQYPDPVNELLKGYKGVYIQQTSDYTTLFRITNTNDFDRFCKDFLYPFFELSAAKSQKLYSFPRSPS